MIVKGVQEGRRQPRATRELDTVAEIVQTVCNYNGGPVTVTHAADVLVDSLGVTRAWAIRRIDLVAADGRLQKIPSGRYTRVVPSLAVRT